ncbi:MAG TPA: M20/M25/M40 family metallo-hydrolase [Opitutaceae bacterium]|nr:M20/M25/M40 family metallo-hydrolase [Opitutaceae bacterium]
MRSRFPARLALALACGAPGLFGAAPAESAEAETLQKIYAEALARGRAYDHLRSLVAQSPGRLSGSKSLERAVEWAEQTLNGLGLDRVTKQDVMVPHWERGGKESVVMVSGAGTDSLNALALGGSGATPETGLFAEVTEVKSLDEIVTLGRGKIEGRIVFFNRPMNAELVRTASAYSAAGDQRTRGPALAAKHGAVGALSRSLTFAHDDVPHTGATKFAPGDAPIPCAALSLVAADKLSAALAAAAKTGGTVRVGMKIEAHTLPDAPSHNVIGEIRGSEFPEEIILVGGHLDSWDIAPGAHDDGAGVVQAIEVLRLFRALGLKPRHTLRCVLFTNEENGTAGSTAYTAEATAKNEKHIFALESDNGGFQPHGFNLGSTQGNAHERAAERWRALFAPYGITSFSKGTGGADVGSLLGRGVTVGGLEPDSQRYFDYHHTATDSIDKVNPRELHLGAAALASLIWLVDTQGL